MSTKPIYDLEERSIGSTEGGSYNDNGTPQSDLGPSPRDIPHEKPLIRPHVNEMPMSPSRRQQELFDTGDLSLEDIDALRASIRDQVLNHRASLGLDADNGALSAEEA